MNAQNESLQQLQHIKRMMERSTRFSSLSGFSSIAAGICGLAGTWLAIRAIAEWKQTYASHLDYSRNELVVKLVWIALATFTAAAATSFVFISLRCKRLGIPVLGMSARRVIINMAIPLFAGGFFVWRLTTMGAYQLIAPACLIFYGLALINASKYTLIEVRYLGFTEVILGIINLWVLGYGIILWGSGFGVVHIIFGAVLWWTYEKKKAEKPVSSRND
jgi:hypothetical protein